MSYVKCSGCVQPGNCAEAQVCFHNYAAVNYPERAAGRADAPLMCGSGYSGATASPSPAAGPPARASRQGGGKVATGPAARPAGGTLTGRVWEIADGLCATVPSANLRASVVQACEAAGINKSTASVQFGKWKIAKDQG